MIARPWLAGLAGLCAVAAVLWGRSARRLDRAAKRIETETANSRGGRDAADLARSAFEKDLHTTVLYAVLSAGLLVASIATEAVFEVPLALLLVPLVVSYRYAPRFLAEARLAEERSQLERRAEEVLEQEELAPRRWAARLAPEELPATEGF